MLGALVFGLCINRDKSLETSTFCDWGGVHYQPIDKVEPKPEHYTYKPDEITIQEGSNQINYYYTPSENNKQTKAIAYEYVFGNTMEQTTALRLQEIDTADLGVNVSYLYSNSKITTEKEHTTDTKFTLQEIAVNKKKYVYIIVSPIDDEIPTTFTTSLTWTYGLPREIDIYHAATEVKIGTHKEIAGLPIEMDTLVKPNTPAGEVVNGVTIPYTFDGWYSDKECETALAESNKLSINAIYIRYANLPSDYLQVSGSEAIVKKGTSQLPENLVIPSTFKGKPVTHINDRIFTGNTTLKNQNRISRCKVTTLF